MFTTRPPYNVPNPFENDAYKWRIAELTLEAPWYICIVHHAQEGINTTFLLSGEVELMGLADLEPEVVIKKLTMAIPPYSHDGENWSFVPVQKLEKTNGLDTKKPPDFYFTATDGSVRIAPFLKKTTRKPKNLEIVFEMPVEGIYSK